MSADVLTRDLRDRRTPAVALGLFLAAGSLLALSISASMGSTIDELTAEFPEALTAFMGGDAPGGYVVGEVFHFIGPLGLVVYAVLSGASALAGEEDKGTLALLSAQPVARTRILAAKAGGLLAGLVTATALFGAGVLLSEALFDVGLDPGNAVAACVHLAALAVFFGMLALATGAVTGRPEVAAGVAGALALVAYVSAAMLPLAGFGDWARLSPWFYYSGSNPLANGLDVAHLVVLLAATAAVVALAVRVFDRRDLRG